MPTTMTLEVASESAAGGVSRACSSSAGGITDAAGACAVPGVSSSPEGLISDTETKSSYSCAGRVGLVTENNRAAHSSKRALERATRTHSFSMPHHSSRNSSRSLRDSNGAPGV